MATTTNLGQKYLYKMFRPNGTYLGLLKNVISPFGYSQDINSAGTQLIVEIGQTADTASDAVEPLETENGIIITTEDGATITTERAPDAVGATNSNALVANDNLIKVYEINRFNSNGKLVFSGFIDKWRTVFGNTENIEATCLSDGQDLNQIPLQTGDTPFVQQVVTDSSTWSYTPPFPSPTFVIQTFTVPSAILAGGFKVRLTSDMDTRLVIAIQQMVGSAPATLPDPQIALGGVNIPLTSSPTDYTVTFGQDNTAMLYPGITYYAIIIATGSNATLAVYANNANPYANGVVYAATGLIYHETTMVAQPTSDLYFVLFSHGGFTTKTYTNTDPSSILSDAIDNYLSQGGAIAKPVAGYSATGISATYTFNINTILEVIKITAQLGPSNWYWYVDPATDILYYQAANTSADHTLIKGNHIEVLDLVATKEDIVNTVFFTGGDDGTGSNVFTSVSDDNSLGANRRGLARLNDPKVIGATGVATGQLLAQNLIDSNDAETYQTTLTINADTYDISTFNLGQMVGFSGFGTFVDDLLLQIVSMDRAEDSVTLHLGTLQKRATQQVEQIKASLNASQTVDNPSTPS